MQNIILLMHCPDQKGIIAAVTDFIHHYKGNIIYIDQYVDRINNTFFMRVEVEANGGSASFSEFQTNFNNSLGVQFGLKCDFYLKIVKHHYSLTLNRENGKNHQATQI